MSGELVTLLAVAFPLGFHVLAGTRHSDYLLGAWSRSSKCCSGNPK